MRKQKLVPEKYEEHFWLSSEDLCSILHMEPDTCLSILNRIYDDEKVEGYDFEVHRARHHYRIPADSFWSWFSQTHCYVED